MAKKNGSYGNVLAPEEAQADVAPTASDEHPVPAVDTSTEDAIPPDQQEQSAPSESSDPKGKPVASLSTDELKSSWASLRGEIDDIEARADDRRRALRVVEQELCERYKKVAEAQKVEPVVMIGGRRMKVKARQERVGGGLGFVDAPIRAAIEL